MELSCAMHGSMPVAYIHLHGTQLVAVNSSCRQISYKTISFTSPNLHKDRQFDVDVLDRTMTSFVVHLEAGEKGGSALSAG